MYKHIYTYVHTYKHICLFFAFWICFVVHRVLWDVVGPYRG